MSQNKLIEIIQDLICALLTQQGNISMEEANRLISRLELIKEFQGE